MWNALIARLHRNSDGQGLAEYALILALIAILCLTALTAVKTGIVGTLNNVANAL